MSFQKIMKFCDKNHCREIFYSDMHPIWVLKVGEMKSFEFIEYKIIHWIA